MEPAVPGHVRVGHSGRSSPEKQAQRTGVSYTITWKQFLGIHIRNFTEGPEVLDSSKQCLQHDFAYVHIHCKIELSTLSTSADGAAASPLPPLHSWKFASNNISGQDQGNRWKDVLWSLGTKTMNSRPASVTK